MTLRLAGRGLEVRLPAGFEGRIFSRAPPGAAVGRTVAQFATFPLPVGAGDFGGGATTLMGPDDIFAVLFEYGPESVGKLLFQRSGMPRRLGPGDFEPYVLRRGAARQSGTQWFFTERARPWTLYAVLGDHGRREALVARLNLLLGNLEVLDGQR